MRIQWIFGLLISAALSTMVQAECIDGSDEPLLCETKEIRFKGSKFGFVTEKATSLGTVPKIYEYLRNESSFKPYFGSKSNSLNSLEGLRGNDLDLASTLIAMLRSQGIKSRYAVGTIKLDKAKAANWLGVQNNELVPTLLSNMGMKEVAISGEDVLFEHVWVEALINYSHYRGAIDALSPCEGESSSCQWISLDPSYKNHNYVNEHKSSLSALSFDYDAFYSAEAPSLSSVNQDGETCSSNNLKYEKTQVCPYGHQNCPNPSYDFWLEKCPYVENPSYVNGLKNQNPLEILEEKAMAYLRGQHPGVTLADVIDSGAVINDLAGLLPASLSYKLSNPSQIRHYASIADHDDVAEVDANSGVEQEEGAVPQERQWARYVKTFVRPVFDGAACDATYALPIKSLSELSTSRFSLGWDVIENSLMASFDGEIESISLGGSIDCGDVVGELTGDFGYGSVFNLELELDGSLLSVGGSEDAAKIKAVYPDLVAGGIYMISTGGEESNWSQVQRAYDAMLEAYEQYPLYTSGGDVYVDYEGEVPNPKFADDLIAQEALTGNLLYAGQRLFYAQLQEHHEKYEGMMNITLLENGRVGVISGKPILEGSSNPNDQPGSAFGFTPEGLLIDLKGNNYSGIWNNLTGEWGRNEEIKFIGHMSSSLEHRVWQELTGLDAISTIRGLQIAKKDGTNLDSIIVDGTSDNFSDFVIAAGYGQGVVTDYVQASSAIELFGKSYVYWDYVGEDVDAEPGLEGLIPNAEGVPTSNLYSRVVSYNTSVRDFLQNFIEDNQIELLLSQVEEDPDLVINRPTCEDEAYNLKSVSTHLAEMEVCFYEQVQESGWTEILNVLDGVDSSQYLLRNKGDASYTVQTLINIQNSLYNNREANERWEYTMPRSPITGSETGHDYDVFYGSKFSGINSDDPVGLITAERYGIINFEGSAGGGYVWAVDPIIPSYEVDGILNNNGIFDFTFSDFFNTTYTDLNLISVVNNDPIFAPSTIDPVSTVTGNMYHDETDLHIPGQGLDYLVTRTYNSHNSDESYKKLSNGWRLSTDLRLQSNDYGEFPNYASQIKPENKNKRTSSITFVDERGGETNFLLDDSSSNSQPTSGYMNFDKLLIDTPEKGTNILEFRNGIKYVFRTIKSGLLVDPDTSGVYYKDSLRQEGVYAKITQIIHPNGLTLNFNYGEIQYPYNESPRFERLLSITDNAEIEGRTGIEFEYYGSCSYDCDTRPNARLQYITDWTDRRWEYKYEDSKLSEVINPNGNSIKYTYVPGTNLLADIIKPEDRNGKKVTTTFSYYENERAYNYVDQRGGTESLSYDLYRKNTRVTHPDGGVTTHYYNAKGALEKMSVPDGGILTFENNEDGFRYIKRDALGYETKYSYNSDLTLDGDESDTYGKVTREQDALGNNIDYTYGINDQITEVTDKRGVVTQYEYYLESNEATGAVKGELHKIKMPQVTANGNLYTDVTLTELKYTPAGKPAEIINYIDPADITRKLKTTFTYIETASGFNVSKTIVANTVDGIKNIYIEQVYDSLWRLKSETLKRSLSAIEEGLIDLTTSFEYDDLGQLTATVDDLGNRFEKVYDKNGLVSHAINRYKASLGNTELHAGCTIDEQYPEHHSCVVQVMEYDEVDRLKAVSNIEGKRTQYVRDAMGRVLDTIDANNHKLSYEYDAKGRRTVVVDQNGHRIETKYDLAGRATQIINPNGKSTYFEYDVLGRLTKQTSPEGRETHFTAYDANGNLLKVTDANAIAGTKPLNSEGATTFKEYDEMNRVIRTLNANNEETLYTYDLLGNMTSITDAEGQETTFTYNDFGRLESISDPIVEIPEDKVESYTYDQAGNTLTKTDRNGEVTHYRYDELNRLIQVKYLNDGNEENPVIDQYTYDQYGDLVQVLNEHVTYDYTYDNQHRLLNKKDSRNNKSMSWTYDGASNIRTKTDYQGDITSYTYDSSNRMVSMQNPAYLSASYQYDGNGALLSRVLSNGASTQYSYDDDGLLLEITQRSANGSIIDKRNYTPDNVGNIDQLVINDSETIDYGYDPAYRLLTANSSVNAHDFAYTYDDVGNRLTKTENGISHHYIYNNQGNRLDEVRAGSLTGPLVNRYEYDDNGSRVRTYDTSNSLVQSLSYNQKRLVTDMTVMSDNMQFAYDINGYRIQKNSPNKTNSYLLEGEHLEAIYDENDQLQSSYLRGSIIDEIINGFERNGDKMLNRNFHNDQVNSLLAMTDHNGNTVQTLSFGPFGEPLPSAGRSTNSFNYTGREQDAETGLYYYRARYYDPEIGRFISEDPLGFYAGSNFYAYVENNPILFADPTGEDNFIYHGIQAFQAAMRQDMSFGDSLVFGYDVAAFDFKTRSGSNATANIQNLHGTGGLIENSQGQRVGQTTAQRFEGITSALNNPSKGLGVYKIPDDPYNVLVAQTHNAFDIANTDHLNGTYGGIPTENLLTISGALDFASGVFEVAFHMIWSDTIAPLFNWGQRVDNGATVIQNFQNGGGAQLGIDTGSGGVFMHPSTSNSFEFESVYRK